jgi:hypothetical protein
MIKNTNIEPGVLEESKKASEEMEYICRDIQPYKKNCSPPPILRTDNSIDEHLKKCFIKRI